MQRRMGELLPKIWKTNVMKLKLSVLNLSQTCPGGMKILRECLSEVNHSATLENEEILWLSKQWSLVQWLNSSFSLTAVNCEINTNCKNQLCILFK